jgi:hypothetical protein
VATQAAFLFVYAVTSAAIPRQHRFQSTTRPSYLLLLQKASTGRDFVGPRYWGRINFLAIVPIEIAPAGVKT